MDTFVLSYAKRNKIGRKVRQVREHGHIPAVVYGHGFPNEVIQLARKDFERYLHRAHASPIVELITEGTSPIPVVVQEVQRDVLSDTPVHVDFHRVRMGETLSAEVQLEFVGTASAVKDLGGVLVKLISELHVECLPKDLVSSIAVDVSALGAIGDHIQVKQLVIPPGLTVKNDPEDMVVLIQAAKEEVLETAKPEVDVSAVEVVGKKEKTEDEQEASDEKES